MEEPRREAKKVAVVLCPKCGKPMHEVAYCWDPEKDDFDVFVSCAKCSKRTDPIKAPDTHA